MLKNALTTHYNVFQPVGNVFQWAEIIFECVGNVSQCIGNVHQRVEQRIANFINVLRLTIDCFVCHANQRPSILWKINKTLLQVLGLCVSPNFRYLSKCFAEIYRFVVHQLPYLLVSKSNSCISRPPIFKVKNQIFIISG